MKTAVVILNWNGKNYLERFLPGLTGSIQLFNSRHDKESHAGLIIADNASSDGSVEMLSEKFPEIPVIRFDRNYGFTGGYNRALEKIEAMYYVLLNSDIEVTEEWLDPLVEWMDSHPLCGACAPKLHSWHDWDMFEYAGAAGGIIDKYGYTFCRGRIMGMVEKDYGQYDERARVFWATGACLVVRAELFRRLGGLDERFFAHMEEIDLCWRLQLEGYHVNIIPESTVYHVGGGSLPNGSPKKVFFNHRNNLLMLRNNLAKTCALQYFNEVEEDIGNAAEYGIRKSRKLIGTRMAMDRLSAIIYLFTFKPGYFKAVLKAHSEFRALAREPEKKEIEQWLEDKGRIADINGLYDKWLIPKVLLYGKRIFRIVNINFNYDI